MGTAASRSRLRFPGAEPVQISAKVSAFFAIVFSATCMWFAIDAFSPTVIDPEQPPSAEFAWFWAFLAVVGAGLAFVSWKISETRMEDGDT